MRVDRGFITGVRAETKPQLSGFLDALAARVDAVLEIDVAVARMLTEQYAGAALDWQADGVLVDFPEGRIRGFLRTPKTTEGDAQKWRARVTRALRRACSPRARRSRASAGARPDALRDRARASLEPSLSSDVAQGMRSTWRTRAAGAQRQVT